MCVHTHICIIYSSTWLQVPQGCFVYYNRGTVLNTWWMLKKHWVEWVEYMMGWLKGDVIGCKGPHHLGVQVQSPGPPTRGARCMWRQGLIVSWSEWRPGLGRQEDHWVRGEGWGQLRGSSAPAALWACITSLSSGGYFIKCEWKCVSSLPSGQTQACTWPSLHRCSQTNRDVTPLWTTSCISCDQTSKCWWSFMSLWENVQESSFPTGGPRPSSLATPRAGPG